MKKVPLTTIAARLERAIHADVGMVTFLVASFFCTTFAPDFKIASLHH